MDLAQLRRDGAEQLLQHALRARGLTAFIGLDGFVDDITHVVDKRINAKQFERVPTIACLAERIAGATGKSTNIELVSQQRKLGGNGPILANALARFGVRVTYLGALGFPHMRPEFAEFAGRAEVYSIAEPGRTDALEFEDGKILLGKSVQLNEITWANIQERFGRSKFAGRFSSAHLVGFVNWTMVPYMTDLWEALLAELCPELSGPRRLIFFDLADPEKRPPADIVRAVQMIQGFSRYFEVVLGLNEKETCEIGKVLGLDASVQDRNDLEALLGQIAERLAVDTIVVHPVAYALACHGGKIEGVPGPVTRKPKITTGAGDHFNAGFCLGKLLGFQQSLSLLLGVATSGYYVRTALSPTIDDLVEMLRTWPEE